MHLLCLLRAPIVLDKAHTLAHYQGDCASWVDFSLVWIGATFDHKVRFPQSSLDLWKSRFVCGFVSGLEIAPLTSNLCSMVQQRWTCSKLAVVTIKICFKTTMGNSSNNSLQGCWRWFSLLTLLSMSIGKSKVVRECRLDVLGSLHHLKLYY